MANQNPFGAVTAQNPFVRQVLLLLPLEVPMQGDDDRALSRASDAGNSA